MGSKISQIYTIKGKKLYGVTEYTGNTTLARKFFRNRAIKNAKIVLVEKQGNHTAIFFTK